jgi:hypothetical protein
MNRGRYEFPSQTVRTKTIENRNNKQGIMFLRKEREKIRHAIVIYRFRVEIYIFSYNGFVYILKIILGRCNYYLKPMKQIWRTCSSIDNNSQKEVSIHHNNHLYRTFVINMVF